MTMKFGPSLAASNGLRRCGLTRTAQALPTEASDVFRTQEESHVPVAVLGQGAQALR